MVGKFHEPVLLREILKALLVKAGAWYIDATLGDGGHSLEIIKGGGNVVGIDVDPQALERASKRFKDAGMDQHFRPVQGNFRDINNLIRLQTDLREIKFKGILLDLGVSSLQLEAPERGFSFMREGPLDMRMDLSLQVRALDLIKALNRKELNELFTKLGEERNAKRVTDAIISAREVGSIESTRQLADLVERTLGGRHGKIHAATKVFQALRIAVNDELNALSEVLPQSLQLVEKDGNILVISFHSLEDRIVKNLFKEWSDQGFGEILTKKPVVPIEEEVRRNARSRSAKLRIFKKS